jgi:hypothetical protein
MLGLSNECFPCCSVGSVAEMAFSMKKLFVDFVGFVAIGALSVSFHGLPWRRRFFGLMGARPV